MRGYAQWGVWTVAALLGLPGLESAAAIPAKTLKQLKAASVYIKVEFMPTSGKGKTVPLSGSGFLVQVAGGAGYIATNSHVISPLATEVPTGNPKVVFFSGLPQEKTVEAHVVARDSVRDLAILKVPAFKDMVPIAMDPAIEVLETTPVYALGFPFGKDLALGKSNPAITITRGTISSLRYDRRGQVNLVQIDAEINPGNSGGPVVDENGQLIGVAVSKIIKTRTVGFAIPLKPLAEMLQGKVASVAFDTLWVVKNQAEVSVEAGLIDPLGKLRDVAIHYRLAGDRTDWPKPDKDGKVALLKGTLPLWLKLSPGRGKGRLTLKGTGSPKLAIAYQASYVTAAGKTVVTPPSVADIDFTQAVYAEQLTRNDARDAKGKLFKVFSHSMKAAKHYVVDMRADPKDMDPGLFIRDASGQVLAEDDGSGGLFDALLVFSPPHDGDYQVVTTAHRGMGPFTLRIREDSGLTLGPKGLTISGTLLANDTLGPALTSPRQSVNLFLKKGKSYTIDVKSKNFDPFLRLENMANLQLKNEDIGGGGHSTLFYSPLRDGIYRVVTMAYDAKDGKFDFTARETPGPKTYTIPREGLKLQNFLNVLDPVDIVNGKASIHRCKVIIVPLQAGQKYQIDLTSREFDTFLRVENLRGRQLAADDDSGGNRNARLFFTPAADGNYRIIITQFDTRVGAYELLLRPLGQLK